MAEMGRDQWVRGEMGEIWQGTRWDERNAWSVPFPPFLVQRCCGRNRYRGREKKREMNWPGADEGGWPSEVSESERRGWGWLTGALLVFGSLSVCTVSSWTSLGAGVNYWVQAAAARTHKTLTVIQPGSPWNWSFTIREMKTDWVEWMNEWH